MVFKDFRRMSADVEQVKNNQGALEEKYGQLRDSVEAVSTQLGDLKVFVDELRSEREQQGSLLVQEMELVRSAREELESSVRSFKDLQRKLENHAFERVNQGIGDAIEQLKKDTKQYVEVKDNTRAVSQDLESLRTELTKFMSISKKISETDFEFREYVKQLTANDHEKLRLMKEIDSLQRLVSSLRRKVRA